MWAGEALHKDIGNKVSFNDELSVKIGTCQNSALSPLLFTIVIQIIMEEFKAGCSWELLHLVFITESSEKLQKFRAWKVNLELRGLW